MTPTPEPTRPQRVVLAVTGASGALYAQRLLIALDNANVETHLVISQWGRRLFKDELDIDDPTPETLLNHPSDRVTLHPYKDVGSVLASGSFHTDGMVVCPCSSHSLAEFAAGVGNALIARAAAVTLKERRRLILVTREMPTSHIDLLNMLRLSEAGAILCPACPGFYMKPKSIDELVDFVVGKILDLLDINHTLNTRWQDELQKKK
jgi:4-hydroxy-3-polyprenylbenzoate decarboxylase